MNGKKKRNKKPRLSRRISRALSPVAAVLAFSLFVFAALWQPSRGLRHARLARASAAGKNDASDADPSGGIRRPHPPPKPGQVLDLTIKQLGNFEYGPENPIPEDVRRLSGTTVRLSGFMIAPQQAENSRTFTLVPSLWGCCFGQPPQVQHMVSVSCRKGPVEMVSDPVVVQGKLTVKELVDDGYVTSLFQVETDRVEPAR